MKLVEIFMGESGPPRPPFPLGFHWTHCVCAVGGGRVCVRVHVGVCVRK